MLKQQRQTHEQYIHETAIIAPSATIGSGVKIGPYSLIGPDVIIGDDTIIGARVTIEGETTIGRCNEIFDGAIIGCRSQDLKFDGHGGPVIIGDNNTIREYVTISAGSHIDESTTLGNYNLLMANCHIGHGSSLENNVKLANATTLAGHVQVHENATIGGLTGIHQFCRIGKFSMTGACSKIAQDIPPFVMCDGHPAKAIAPNSVGLKRANFSATELRLLKKAYKCIFRSGNTPGSALKILKSEFAPHPVIKELIGFLGSSERGICS